jgi:hypothetical protein
MAGYTGTQNTRTIVSLDILVVTNSASYKWKCQSILCYLTHFCRPVYRSTFQFWSWYRRGQTNSIQAMRLSRKNSLPSSLIYLDTIIINLETYSTDYTEHSWMKKNALLWLNATCWEKKINRTTISPFCLKLRSMKLAWLRREAIFLEVFCELNSP